MIEYIEGDIFKSPAQVIVNTVNTMGVMGKGLALEFKQRYPEMFAQYRTACEKKQLTIGKLMLWYAPDYWILLFPTKENWRKPSKLEYIEKGLIKFVQTYADKSITSIAFPKLGCGNGELNWDDVRPLMENYLKNLPIDVYIYLGLKKEYIPEHKNQKETLEWLNSNAKDMSFNGLKDDITYNCSVLPFALRFMDKQYNVRWDDGLIFTSSDNQMHCKIDEKSLYKIWDEIRIKGVFPAPPDNQLRILVYALLESLGYLSEVRIKNNKTLDMVDGYQLNEGFGRIYSLKGI
ncbi:MAG: macro domain-containing protein [Clostridiaceae bacterium]|jgi:O-acetyl-ADP-ribose deacetylase (regulator of RNase III)|nr:macro domain-containing protein [Clostridiaceae bacterium]